MSTQIFKHCFPVLLAAYSNLILISLKNDSGGLSRSSFMEGTVYTKTTFPNHPLNEAIKDLQFETGDYTEQHGVIQALKKHQQSIGSKNEQEIKDAFFVSGMMVLPAYTKTYFTTEKTLVHTEALGYNLRVLINNNEERAKMVIHDRDKNNIGTIHFQLQDMAYAWQKYQVNAEQYVVQHTSETAVIAGYRCEKVVYTFKGTTRGIPVTNYVINLQPEKVTLWVTDQLPPSFNVQHPLSFELDKAVLKLEVAYDKKGGNLMLVETTKIESGKIADELMEVNDVAPVVNYKKNTMEAEMMVMQVMLAAIGLLAK